MNYKDLYYLIITKRKKYRPEGLVERHHVVPRCLGGDDSKENMVLLTPKEHFLCHRLLAKIHGGALWSAYYFMSHPRSNSARGVKLTSSQYSTARKNYVSYLKSKTGTKNPNYGNRYSEEAKKKISDTRKKYLKRNHPRAINDEKEWRHESGEYFIGSHFDLSDMTGLPIAALRKVSKGDFYSYKGWVCISSGRKNMRKGENTNTADKNIYQWVSPEGEIFNGSRDYAVNFLGLDRSGTSNLVRGTVKKHKKWSVIL